MVQFTKGKVTGLGIHAFATKLFIDNEVDPIHISDVVIAKLLVAEFPTRKSKVFKDLRSGKLERVQQLRTRFNRGELTNHVKPLVISHRYDESGHLNDPIYSGKRGVSLTNGCAS